MNQFKYFIQSKVKLGSYVPVNPLLKLRALKAHYIGSLYYKKKMCLNMSSCQPHVLPKKTFFS